MLVLLLKNMFSMTATGKNKVVIRVEKSAGQQLNNKKWNKKTNDTIEVCRKPDNKQWALSYKKSRRKKV